MRFCGENTSNLNDLSTNHVVNKVKLGARQVAKPYLSDETLPVQWLTSLYKKNQAWSIVKYNPQIKEK